MRYLLALAAILAGTGASLADDCVYVGDAGRELRFLEDGENTVTIAAGDALVTCSWAATPDGPHTQTIACDDGTEEGFFFGSLERGSGARDLLIYAESIWYRECDTVSKDGGI